MVSESAPSRQRILLVTGMLGAGKSTALRELEDLGWESIDNFPIRLLDRLLGGDTSGHPLAIGFDCRTRGFVPAEVIEEVKALSGRDDLEITTLFLDCAGHELTRRFDETRRRHFLARDLPVPAGIKAERELLAPMRRWADVLIDTTDFTTNDLKQRIRDQFGQTSPREMTVTVSSFGFSRGMPPATDLVFDMRFLDNPHWQPGLKELTGLDAPVAEYIASNPVFESSFARMRDLLLELLPQYAAQGKSYVNIAFGCTGGRHRSVFTAELMAQALREGGFSPTVLHRNLGSRAAELVEGSKAP
ncbi:RNase adapter RapZ [Alteraurantiacibacter aquimixticola]|uniref:RNase adapter RapZ n=1 Tax=Alteraurantiacibacter aquimixticola TaxID=2489173 RepID=A0A4T3F5N3_9SPHN|nr:RNase adapter RapZ [Alteraurantiacibacter aquimixticola]TIX51789.1 RNase adapter RapZ [Alteraurantiacibacter aquimixticola]